MSKYITRHGTVIEMIPIEPHIQAAIMRRINAAKVEPVSPPEHVRYEMVEVGGGSGDCGMELFVMGFGIAVIAIIVGGLLCAF